MAKRNRGFFIIWGARNRVTSDGKGSFDAVCPNCHKNSSLHGKALRRWFTLYFIPIFPTGEPLRFTQCAQCKFQFRATLEELRATLLNPGSGASSFAAAIALFNSMRETPNDSAKLESLLRMYLEMGEPNEAISAARQFPAAIEQSDGCMAIMSIVCANTGDREMARRYAAAALALNPANSEAQRTERELNSSPPSEHRLHLPGASA